MSPNTHTLLTERCKNDWKKTMGVEKRRSSSVVTKGTDCSVWFQPDRRSSWGTQLIFNLIGWRGKLWAKRGQQLKQFKCAKRNYWRLRIISLLWATERPSVLRCGPNIQLKMCHFIPAPISIALCEAAVFLSITHIWREAAFSGCQIQSGNLYCLQISVTVVIPL